jgi:DNA-directed RNA polymerase specialized sigma24 family protein
MKTFKQRSVFADNNKKREAIRLYAMEDKTLAEIAQVFGCPVEHVRRMLAAQGQLL